MLTGQIQKDKKAPRAANKKVILILKPKRYLFKVFSYKKVSKSLLHSPQKMFGGPHADRGPHFGHIDPQCVSQI